VGVVGLKVAEAESHIFGILKCGLGWSPIILPLLEEIFWVRIHGVFDIRT
jgi:hypothetical protein